MKVTTEKTGACEYALNIEVEPERLQEPLRQAAQRLNKRHPLAGFRPGKAPYALVERVYGKELIYDEMLDKISNDLYQEALKESKLEPYAAAHLDIVKLEPLTLKFTLPVRPVVTLGDYHKIRVAQKAVQVSETEVEEVLKRMREAHAIWQPVERPTKMGDQVLLDAEGTAEDGTKTNEQDLNLELREDMTPPDFGKNLVGIKLGENKEFEVQYPQDYRDKSLAGKRVRFQVTVKAVKEKELPELNDDFAKNVGSYESLAQLRGRIEEELRAQKEAEARDAALTEALDQLVEQSTMEYPAIAVEHETQSMIDSFAERLSQQGFTLDGYLGMMNKTGAQFYDETRPKAETRLKRTLALAEFAAAEGITVEAQEIEQEAERLSQPYGEKADAIKAIFGSGEPRRTISNDVFRRKALDRLLAIATGTAEPVKAEEKPATDNSAPS